MRSTSPPLLLILLPLFFLASHPPQSESLPLSTSGRWIVDAVSGQRVKLRCVNWAAHLPAVLAEGLDRQPVEDIAASVLSMGFNCLRLTWATHMWTDDRRYANLTVAGSLQFLGLRDAVAGLARNNPRMLSMTVRDAYGSVVQAAAGAGLMLVLDNHISRPQWCCGEDDGNGFFGDADFDTEEWLTGLEAVASRFRHIPQVVGMSLRNELRGPRQNIEAWHQNMARGCNKIHEANPDLLVVVSGLRYDTDLSFLRQRPLRLGFDGKLVLEVHSYAFSGGHREHWEERLLAPMCARMAREFEERAGFVARGNAAVPLFVSEFGGDQSGIIRGDNRFLSCFFAMAAQRDLEWALWALQGSYYIRKGQPGFEEMFGVLDREWNGPRRPMIGERFNLVQEMLQDPGRPKASNYEIIYHPGSGRCLSADERGRVQLEGCENRSRWGYEQRRQSGTPRPIRRLFGEGELYLEADGEGKSVAVRKIEAGSGARVGQSWSVRLVSGFPFQIAGKDAAGSGRDLCLEREDPNSRNVVGRECVCLESPTCLVDPRPQWFIFISSNVM